jgi:hypothetical protein
MREDTYWPRLRQGHIAPQGCYKLKNKNSQRIFVYLILFGAVLLGGCVTTSGNYTVTAIDTQGKPINMVFQAQGRHIYSARNGICAVHPKAVVTIRTQETGKELEGESPFQCR